MLIKKLTFITVSILLCSQLLAMPLAEGTGNLGVIIERNAGAVVIVDNLKHKILTRVEGLGNLSHATVVFSRSERFFFTFQRDGWINKVDILTGKVVAQVKAGDNAIGGAVSQDGKYIAVSNYKPGDIKIVEAESLKIVKVIPAFYQGGNGQQLQSRTVGIVDGPQNQFYFALMDAGEIWQIDVNPPEFKIVKQWKGVGDYPYDAILTGNGRYYVAGFLRSNWIVQLDLWNINQGPVKVSTLDPNLQSPKVPMYKVPHLSGWGISNGKIYVPMISEERLMIYDTTSWKLLRSVKSYGTVVFAVPRPDGKEIWLTFAGPKNDTLQIYDVPSGKIVKKMKLGKGVMHIQFTPKGESAYVSIRRKDQVAVLNSYTHQVIKKLEVKGPSGIFFTNRAHVLGL
jgi:protein NirF